MSAPVLQTDDLTAALDRDPPAVVAPAPAGPAPVVGGGPAPVGAWEDAVALYGLGQLACSGVLIAPDLVLTAGHCRAALDYAVVGATDLRSGGERISVLDAVAHPDPYTTYDVALITLEHPAAAQPRPLALDCVVEGYLHDGADVAIVGYGATDDFADEFPDDLQQAFTTVVDADCLDFDGGCNESVSPGGELVAGGEGIDSCLGDSGGPLYLQTGDAFAETDAFLVGITSRARVPADAPCGGGGIYVRVDAVADWIERTAGRTLPRPDCEGFNHPPVPTAAPIEVVQGGTALSVVDPGDADGDTQQHTFRVVEPPAHGVAQLTAGGGLVYLAPDVLPDREDQVVVEVADDGAPPRTGRVTIPVRVTPGPVRRSGCSTSAAAGWAWLAALAGMLRRRR
ncbi:MAG: trypsin-like serine protease [Myxococcota bacterium]